MFIEPNPPPVLDEPPYVNPGSGAFLGAPKANQNLDVMVPTPYRRTWLEFPIDELKLSRGSYRLVHRTALQMAKTRNSNAPIRRAVPWAPIIPINGVRCIGDGAWVMWPYGGFALSSGSVATAFQAGVPTGAQVNIGSGFSYVPLYHSPDQPGAGPVGLAGLGGFALRRDPQTGQDWSTGALPDAAAYPSPTLPDPTGTPLDRALVTRVQYGNNDGFFIRFAVPRADWYLPGPALRFLWGGPVTTTPLVTAGAFCLTVYPDGQAILHELAGAGTSWTERGRFHWSDSTLGGGVVRELQVVPYGPDGIALVNGAVGGQHGQHRPGYREMRRPNHTTLAWRSRVGETGFTRLEAASGAGVARLDVNRIYRYPISFGRLEYSGVNADDSLPQLTDDIFELPAAWPDTGGIPMTLTIDQFQLDSRDGNPDHRAHVIGQIFRADDGTGILPVFGDQYLTVAGVRQYFVQFTFVPSQDDAAALPLGHSTPVLRGYSIDVESVSSFLAHSKLRYEVHESVSISGPDFRDPDHETLHCWIRSLGGKIPPLETRSRIPARLVTEYAADSQATVTLWEGEIVRAIAREMGQDGAVWPSPDWTDYDITGLGKWALLKDQKCRRAKSYVKPPYLPSETADDNPELNGASQPWKATSVLKDLFTAMGWSPSNIPGTIDDYLDMSWVGANANDIRLWPGAQGGESEKDVYSLQVGGPYYDFIIKLCWEYLDAAIIWDANAQVNLNAPPGMWRLLPNAPVPVYSGGPAVGPPSPWGARPSTPLWSFVRPRKAVLHAGPIWGALTGNQSWMLEYRHYPVAPEFNHLVVTASGETGSEGLPTKLTAEFINRLSYDADPANPTSDASSVDFLGHEVYQAYYDPTLDAAGGDNRRGVQWLGRLLYKLGGHGRFEGEVLSVNVLVEDVNDPVRTGPRPLRVGDPVLVDGFRAVIENAHISYEHDHIQLAEYEVLFLENPTG